MANITRIDANVEEGGFGQHTANLTVHYADGTSEKRAQSVTGGRARWAEQIASVWEVQVSIINIGNLPGISIGTVGDRLEH